MKKSKGIAITSLVFGLFFWLPLLNVLLGIIAILFGIKAIRLRRANPDQFGGKWMAIAGIILGAIPIVFSIIGLTYCLAGYSDICVNIGLWFLA